MCKVLLNHRNSEPQDSYQSINQSVNQSFNQSWFTHTARKKWLFGLCILKNSTTVIKLICNPKPGKRQKKMSGNLKRKKLEYANLPQLCKTVINSNRSIDRKMEEAWSCQAGPMPPSLPPHLHPAVRSTLEKIYPLAPFLTLAPTSTPSLEQRYDRMRCVCVCSFQPKYVGIYIYTSAIRSGFGG